MEGRLLKTKRFDIVGNPKGPNQETGMKETDSSDFLGVKLLDLGDPSFPMRGSLSSLENETPARAWLKEQGVHNQESTATTCQKLFHHPVLLRLGHKEHEITELTATFTKCDQDGNHVLDEKEQKQMQQDLEEERVSPVVGGEVVKGNCSPSPPCRLAQNTNPN